jgi:hypothetical protein
MSQICRTHEYLNAIRSVAVTNLLGKRSVVIEIIRQRKPLTYFNIAAKQTSSNDLPPCVLPAFEKRYSVPNPRQYLLSRHHPNRLALIVRSGI